MCTKPIGLLDGVFGRSRRLCHRWRFANRRFSTNPRRGLLEAQPPGTLTRYRCDAPRADLRTAPSSSRFTITDGTVYTKRSSGRIRGGAPRIWGHLHRLLGPSAILEARRLGRFPEWRPSQTWLTNARMPGLGAPHFLRAYGRIAVATAVNTVRRSVADRRPTVCDARGTGRDRLRVFGFSQRSLATQSAQ